jgi:uncharacterized membrane protein YdjX (TVP38/TMEM64 family)
MNVRDIPARTRVLAACALALLLAALWLHWPAGSSSAVTTFLADAEHGRDSPWAPLIALVCFALGGLLVFPVNLLIAATIVVFGPVAGALYALTGSTLSAALVHEIGRALPPQTGERWFGARGERLRKRIVGHGLFAVALVRLLPVAPYSIVGFLSGVARIRRVDYLFGTALGMAPGIVLYALFVDRARAVLFAPHPFEWVALAFAALLLVAMGFALQRWRKCIAARDAAQ